MLKKIIFMVFIIIFFTNCSKKIDVTTYNNVTIPLKHLEKVNITIDGSEAFVENINSFLPYEFDDKEILQDEPNSPYILHIIEKELTSDSKFYDSQEEKTIQYLSYTFDAAQNKTIPIVRTKDIIYFQRCLVTSYTLEASVTTRYKRDTISATIQDQKCLKRRFNLFNNHSFQATHSSNFYKELVDKLSLNIKNYLIPHYITYSIAIDEDIDVDMQSIDEENYENILDMLSDGIYSDEMLYQLIKLNHTYPNSYSINYNIGVVYEYLGKNSDALFYYKKSLDIKTTKDIIQRIKTVKKNIINKEKIKLN